MDPVVPIQRPFPEEPLPTEPEYTGIFRAKVKKNDDRSEKDKYLGRIKVWVPQIHGEEYEDREEDLPWAWPVFLHAHKTEDGIKSGFFAVPPVDSWVYVLFEGGLPDRPIWFGGWFSGESGDTELHEYLKQDQRSSARYPDILGWISPHDGKVRFRVLKSDRCEITWFDGEEQQVLLEMDSIGYPPNTEPTVRLDTKWRVWVKAEKDIKLESEKKVEIKCKSLEVKATDEIIMESEGGSTYKAAGVNKFEGAQIVGHGRPNGGFDLYGRELRT